jgi:hypothetical protein
MPGYTLPKKPEGGWPLLVTPLLGDGKRGTPFVALPDASRRELNEDEKLYLDYFKKEVRAARMVRVGHAWEVSGDWREFFTFTARASIEKGQWSPRRTNKIIGQYDTSWNPIESGQALTTASS